MTKRVFVRGLNRDTSSDALRQAFAGCGNVVDARIALDQAGRSRSYGFVTFERDEGARRAIDTLQGTVVAGSALMVQNASTALPKTSVW